MNRIYQGKVSRVDILRGKDNWEELREWQSFLWYHHELFQDAVNYYTLALAALGIGLPDEHSMSQLRRQMEVTAWKEFPKKTLRKAQSLRESVAPWLGIGADASFEEACAVIVSPQQIPPALSNQVIQLLCQDLAKTSDIGEYGKSAAPKYINPAYRGNFRDEFARKGLEALEFRLAVHGSTSRSLKGFGALSLATASQRESREAKRGANARSVLKTFVKKLAGENLLTAEEAADLSLRLGRLTDEATIEIPSYEAGGESREKSLGVPALLIGKQLGFSPTLLECLRRTISRPPENWEKSLKELQDAAANKEDPLRTARNLRGGFIFKAFTALSQWEQTPNGKPLWIEFDVAAFKEALKTINQFNVKTEERRLRRNDVGEELKFMLGEHPNPNWKPKKENEEADEREVTILGGDPRYKKLKKLLMDMDEEGAVHAGGEIYGPSQPSLRGFGKLRSGWMDVLMAAKGHPTEADLQTVVADLQREHKLDMGYTTFFLKLCEAEYWELWRDDTEAETNERRANKWAKSVIYAAAEARELAEELDRLKDPIHYTPAEAEFSRRLFMFSDISGAEGAKHKQAGAVEVSIGSKNERGMYTPQRALLHYSAPRLVRDQLSDGVDAKWLQPMMTALGLGNEDHAFLAKRIAVALMPDFANGDRELRMLLNFPVDLNTEKLVSKIGKAARWAKQFNTAYEKSKLKQRFHLIWPGMKLKETQKPAQFWWDDSSIQRDGFTCIAIDLGQRRAADFALLYAGVLRDIKSFVELGSDGSKSWFATLRAQGSLRLPGENAVVRREQTDVDRELLRRRGKNPGGDGGKKLRVELYGSNGRNATLGEYEAAVALAKQLLHDEDATALETKSLNWLGDDPIKFSFPEQNDKLISLYLGALSRFRTWQRWSWRLALEHQTDWEKTLKEIEKLPYFAAWSSLAAKGPHASSVIELRAMIAQGANGLLVLLETALVQIANRVLPLRTRGWRWIDRPTGETEKPLHLLVSDCEATSASGWLRGQRGLSIARIEQLENFRRAVLSLNRLLRNKIGVKPDFGSSTRGETLPDPCPELTDKIVRIKEERVNQTAHLIIAQALGVRLKEPTLSDEERKRRDIHGEYEIIPGRSPVDFIVLEDLARYTTDKSRSRSENSRLMKWCHRAINEKVKMLAEPFGIPVLEVFASYSSKFDARTGAPGFRAIEVTSADRPFWQKTIEKNEIARGIFDCVDDLAAKGQNVRLVVPQNGGPLFLAAVTANQPLLPIRQADINAAVNIGLRAIGGPSCLHAHPRVRLAKGKSGGNKGKWVTRRDNKREGAQFIAPAEVTFQKLASDSDLLKGDYTNLFHDPKGIAWYGLARIQDSLHPPLAHASDIFSRGKDATGIPNGAIARLEWEVCRRINVEWLKKHNCDTAFLHAQSPSKASSEADDVPMEFA
jgi:hypothetical protein